MRAVLLFLVLLLPAKGVAGSEWAVLRITSHGCSGTVIYADSSRSLILSCAHMFLAEQRYPGEPERIDPALIARSFTFDAPHPTPGADPRPGIRLLKYDVATDLCLIQVNARLPYVCPVATTPPSGVVASAGYDLMQWPAVVRRATLSTRTATQQFTLERPRSGRSGGPLISSGGVVGVCTGYMGKPSNLEVVPGGYGIYVSHEAICKFLGKAVTEAPRAIDAWDGSYRAVPRPPEFQAQPGVPSVGEQRRPVPVMPPACGH